MRFHFLLIAVAMGSSGAVSLSAQGVTVAPFRSIELRDGGTVVVRYGTTAGVRVLSGDPRNFEVAVEGTHLRIGKCRSCPHERGRRIEVVTPVLDSVTVMHGGSVVLEGQFPAQTRLAATVSNGGAIDARVLNAEQVTASVEQGGTIFTRPSRRLDAAVTQGGAITYWGTPTVRSNVAHGGVVVRGRAEDANRPLRDLGPAAAPLPPIPPAPPSLHRL